LRKYLLKNIGCQQKLWYVLYKPNTLFRASVNIIDHKLTSQLVEIKEGSGVHHEHSLSPPDMSQNKKRGSSAGRVE
jgi:hypothetical protein